MSETGFHSDVPVSQFFPRESNNWMCHGSKDFHCSTLAAEVTVPDLIFIFDAGAAQRLSGVCCDEKLIFQHSSQPLNKNYSLIAAYIDF